MRWIPTPMSPGCARVLSGWCHGYAWDDDLWPLPRLHTGSLFSSAPKHKLESKMGDVVVCRMPLTPPPAPWRCEVGRTLPGGYTIIFSDNLFLQTCSELKMTAGKRSFSEGHHQRLDLFKMEFLHVFFFSSFNETEVSKLSDMKQCKDLFQPLWVSPMVALQYCRTGCGGFYWPRQCVQSSILF